MKYLYDKIVKSFRDDLICDVNEYVNFFNDINIDDGFKMYIDIESLLYDLDTIINNDVNIDIYVAINKYSNNKDNDNLLEDLSFLRIETGIKNSENYIEEKLSVYKDKTFNIRDSRKTKNVIEFTDIDVDNEYKIETFLNCVFNNLIFNDRYTIRDLEDRYVILKYKLC